jgi:hypothetical protein
MIMMYLPQKGVIANQFSRRKSHGDLRLSLVRTRVGKLFYDKVHTVQFMYGVLIHFRNIQYFIMRIITFLLRQVMNNEL